MGRSSTVELRFLVPAVGGSNPSVPAPKNIALQAHMDLERFFVGERRDSNPQGCGAEETRSVFQRSTQGAKRRSGTRPPKRRTRNPSVPHQPRAPRVLTSQPSATSGGIRTRKATQLLVQHEKNLPSKDRRPKPIRTKSALHLENISPVPKSESHATTM